MNANEFTYGIEIETAISRETAVRERLVIAPYHSNSSQVPYLPQGLVAEQDRSIRAERGYTGCEIIGPVLKGEKGAAAGHQSCQDAERKRASRE